MKETLMNDVEILKLVNEYGLDKEWLDKSKCLKLSLSNNKNFIKIIDKYIGIYFVRINDEFYLRIDNQELNYLCCKYFK